MGCWLTIPSAATAQRSIPPRVAGSRPSLARPIDPLFHHVVRRAGLELTTVGDAALVHRGDDHLDRIAAACAAASGDISVEMYELGCDRVGRRALADLTAAAARGVRVRLLLDAWGSGAVSAWVAGLDLGGVELRWFNRVRPWRNPFRRTHRKLVVVDGCTASVGGVNLTEEFSESCRGDQAWRDVAVWLSGSAATVLQRQFDATWREAGGEAAAPVVLTPSGDGEPCALAGGACGRHGHAAAYEALVAAARRELLVATPYFTPPHRFRAALTAAARRGVRVVVTIPRRTDLLALKHAGRRLYSSLLASGVEIRERTDRMVHAKVAVVDGEVAALGSVNLNRQSFYGNSETLLLTPSRQVVRELRSLILDEGAWQSELLSETRWPRHPDRHRGYELLAAPVAMLF